MRQVNDQKLQSFIGKMLGSLGGAFGADDSIWFSPGIVRCAVRGRRRDR